MLAEINSEKPFKILVTRPSERAGTLIQALEQAGFSAELLPSLEFKALNPSLFRGPLEQLAKASLAIFTSVTAVQYGLPAILNLYPRLPNILYAAIGPATFKALQAYPIQNMILPERPPFESETLLEHPALQKLQGQSVFIFRGKGGRELLAQTLKQRAAQVYSLDCYESQIPTIDIAQRLNTWSQHPFQASIVSSAQGLKNLNQLLGKAWPFLAERPMILVGLRMKDLATNLGVNQVIVANGADDVSLLEALTTLRNSIQ